MSFRAVPRPRAIGQIVRGADMSSKLVIADGRVRANDVAGLDVAERFVRSPI